MKKKLVGIFVCMLFMISAFSTVMNVKARLHEDNQMYLSDPEMVGISFLNDGPEEEWNVSFGGNKYDVFFTVQETIDGGFIALGGRDASSWDVGGDCWLVKIDENGDMQWNKTFGGSKTDNGHGVLQISDDGFIISAITESYGAGSADAWVIRTDADGNELWNKTYGGNLYDLAEKTIPLTPEGDFLVVGNTLSFGTSGSRDGWLIKIDADGNELWNKTYGTKDSEHLWEVHVTSDGEYVMIGFVENSSTHRQDAWVVKTDADGNLLWAKKYGPAYQGLSIHETTDKGYIFLAEVEDTVFGGYLNAWMVKINKDGDEEWNKLFITPQGEDCFAVHHNIQHIAGDGFILTGVTNAKLPVYSVGDMWLTKTDEDGNILWEKIIGGSGYDTMYTVGIASDGGFICAGMTKSFGAGSNFNAWLVKVSDYENQRPNKPSKPTGKTQGNPGEEYTFSSTASEPDGEQLYYAWDWGDGNYSYWLGPYSSGYLSEATYSWESVGSYEVRVKAKDVFGGESDWSDPLTVTITKSKDRAINTPFLNFLKNYPNLSQILLKLIQRLGLQ